MTPVVFLVEAVDDAGVEVVDIGRAAEDVVHDAVGERAGLVAAAGVDDDAGGLVEDKQVVVFVEDVERYRLGLDDAVGHFGQAEADDVTEFERVTGLARAVVDEDVALADHALEEGARDVVEAAAEVRVEARGARRAAEDDLDLAEDGDILLRLHLAGLDLLADALAPV